MAQKLKAPTFVGAFSSNMAVREGFEPSIHLRVYTLSRRAPSATQTPHRVVTALTLQRGGTIGIGALRVKKNLRETIRLLNSPSTCGNTPQIRVIFARVPLAVANLPSQNRPEALSLNYNQIAN